MNFIRGISIIVKEILNLMGEIICIILLLLSPACRFFIIFFISIIIYLIYFLFAIIVAIYSIFQKDRKVLRIETPTKIRALITRYISIFFSAIENLFLLIRRNSYLKKSLAIILVLLCSIILINSYIFNNNGKWYLYQKGIASWYGPGFYWKRKADGSIYSPWDVSAASKSIPLGTVVKVVNLLNGKYIFLTIDDRGPYVKGRILDLSYMAAWRLGAIKKGLIPVAIYMKMK